MAQGPQGLRFDAEHLLDGVRDHFSETTRKARRALLATCVVAVAYMVVGIVPSRLALLGLEFDHMDQYRLSWGLFLGLIGLVVYFMVEFFLFARRDYIAFLTTAVGHQDHAQTLRAREYNFYDWRVKLPAMLRLGFVTKDEAVRRISLYRALYRFVPVCQPRMFPLPRYGVQAALDFYLPLALGVCAIIALVVWEPKPQSSFPWEPWLPE